MLSAIFGIKITPMLTLIFLSLGILSLLMRANLLLLYGDFSPAVGVRITLSDWIAGDDRLQWSKTHFYGRFFSTLASILGGRGGLGLAPWPVTPGEVRVR